MRTAMQTYDRDISAWASEQARLLRAKRFDLLDVEHIADEIDAVGKSEQRELASGMAALFSNLLQWAHQKNDRGASREKAITAQRKEIAYVLDGAPSLMSKLQEPRWLDMVWTRAVAQAVSETGLDCFPEECPWSIQGAVLAGSWLPE